MNFLLTRNKYKGPLNKLAYVGMLGDLATVFLLYAYWKNRQVRKLANAEKLAKEEKQKNSALFPKRTEIIDYNDFSPYTPIPYYSTKVTKYQHEHIDLLGYLNEKQLNVEKCFFGGFYDSYDKSQRKLLDWHDPYGTKKHHGHDDHSESHESAHGHGH